MIDDSNFMCYSMPNQKAHTEERAPIPVCVRNMEEYELSKRNEEIIADLQALLDASQINLEEDDLYEASADRYKKYARAKRVLNVPQPLAIVYPNSA